MLKAHKDNKESYYKAFQEAVVETFGKLAEDYSLKLEQKDADTFLIPLSSFDIQIVLVSGHLLQTNVLIVPRDTYWNTRLNKRSREGIGIINFVRYQNPEFPETYFIVNSPEEVPSKLQTLCDLLRKYCDSFLRGDFSIWQSVIG